MSRRVFVGVICLHLVAGCGSRAATPATSVAAAEPPSSATTSTTAASSEPPSSTVAAGVPGTSLGAATTTAPSPPPTPASSTTTTLPPAATTTTTAPSFDALEWARVPFDSAVYGGPGHLPRGAVLPDGRGVVTVGADVTGEDWDAAVWFSADGATRERVPHDEAVFGGPGDQAMTAVVAAGPGLVAVGYERKMAPVVVDNGGTIIDDEVYDAVVWTSADGIAWSRVGDADHVFSSGEEQDDQVIAAVTAGGPGLVAVGYERDRWFRAEARFNVRFGIDMHAAVWISEDGITWKRVPDADGVFGAGAGGTPEAPAPAYEMQGVTSWRGGLAAVGTRDAGDLDFDAAVWLSEDGISWTRVSDDDAVFRGRTDDLEIPDDLEMRSVAAGGPGLVAVGSDTQSWTESGGVVRRDTDAAVWVSADGVVWRRVPHDEAVFGGEDIQEMDTVVATPSGLVALGFDYSTPQPADVMWVSPPSG